MSSGPSSSIGHLDLNAIKNINVLSAKEKHIKKRNNSILFASPFR